MSAAVAQFTGTPAWIEHNVYAPARRTRQTPLLLQHGAWHGAWCWHDTATHLAGCGYEVHTLSLPAHGDSADRKNGINKYSLADYTQFLYERIDTITPAPALIGHSLGGALVQRCLTTRRLPAAVLLAPVPISGALGATLRAARRAPGPVLRQLLLADGFALVREPALAAHAFLGPQSTLKPQDLAAKLVPESVRVLTALALAPGFAPSKVSTPLAVFAAEHDGIFTIDEQQKTAQAYGAQFRVMSGQGHDLMLEPAWRQLADAIDGFLADKVGVN